MKLALGPLALLAALLAAAPAAQAQARQDRLTPRKGPPVDGTILRETFKEVVIKPASGADQVYKVEDVARIEYWDTPDAFRAGMADFEAGNWLEALNKFNSAEDFVSGKGMQTKPKPPRAWFPYWLSFHRGHCLHELDRWDDAVKELQRHVDMVKDPGVYSRFLVPAHEAILESHRAKGDEAAMSAHAAAIAKAPKEIQPKLQLVLDKQKAELLLDKGQADAARAIFEKLATNNDAQIKADGTAGVIRCHEKGGNADALVAFCNGVIASTPADQPALLLLASNALGNSYFEKKQWRKAADALVGSVVKYHPGRGHPLVREHERALYLLAKSYEAWSNEAGISKDLAVQARVWAARTWRELSIEYPGGRYREEALNGIVRCEPTDEKKDEK